MPLGLVCLPGPGHLDVKGKQEAPCSKKKEMLTKLQKYKASFLLWSLIMLFKKTI